MNQLWQHFKTITYHKWLVLKGCFAVGLYWQGLTHDLSKYAPEEFFNGVRYYQGYRSPNNAEREDKGYSAAWLHHKGRNKHHFEYWQDYDLAGEKEGVARMVPMPMPDRYIIEMYEDRIAASKVYMGEKYTSASAWQYYKKGDISALLHPHTRELLERLLYMTAKHGEAYTNRYIRCRILKNASSCRCRK
ncbi:MAG: catalase [Lachnospiraceae bacterium]|nr:catalase [Lachnospiraceae bacterium]